MRLTRSTNPIRRTASLLAGLLLAISVVPAAAQEAAESHLGRGFGPVYDAAHEITLTGTIQEVVTQHVAGSPAGIHLLVAGPHGVVDAHVGPFLSKQTKESLQVGMPVRIVGAMSSPEGKSYLLARVLTVGATTVIVRSAHGLLLPVPMPRAQRGRTERTSQLGSDAGAR